MGYDLYKTILLVLPILFSGLVFIITLKLKMLKFLRRPVDFGISFNNKRLFGDNKTFLGFVVMSAVTAIYGLLFYQSYNDTFNLNLNLITSFISFLLLGLSYSMAELPNSFIKRRLGIVPGGEYKKSIFLKHFFIFIDQIDSLLGTGLVWIFVFNVRDFLLLTVTLFLGFFIHLSLHIAMQKMKLKKL